MNSAISTAHRLITFLKNPFRLDYRALALMRIGVGVVVLLDLLFRLPDLVAHYSNEGVLPLSVLFEHGWQPYHISLHTISGLWQAELLLFLIAGVLAVCLALGYRTRSVTLGSWLMLLSLHNRNPYILQGGDDLLRLLLFWGIFLPWSKCWSIDSRKLSFRSDSPFTGAAAVGYVLLVLSIYIFSALMKTGPEWTTEGTAVYYALSLDQLVLPLGKLLYPYSDLLRFMTFSVWWVELLLPLLILLPTRSYWPRTIAIVGLAGLHLGFALTLFVGLFFVIGWVSLLGLLPPVFMDWFERKLSNWRLMDTIHLRVSRQLQLVFGSAPSISPQGKRRWPEEWLYLKEILLGALVIYCLFWNFNNTPGTRLGMPGRVQGFGHLLRLDQYWGMFAPEVFKDDGWYILEGKTARNKLIDLRSEGSAVSYRKPERIVTHYSSDRWRKYAENYLFVSNQFLRLPYCFWQLQRWNADKSHPYVQHLDVVYMKEVSQPDYRLAQPVREVLCSCEAAPLPPE